MFGHALEDGVAVAEFAITAVIHQAAIR